MLQGWCLCEELLPARVHPRGSSSTIPMGGLEWGRGGESCFGGGDVAQNVAAQCVWACVCTPGGGSVFCSYCEAVPETGLMPAWGRV